MFVWGWRKGSVVKHDLCSVRGPRFRSQHPQCSLQSFVTLVPGEMRCFFWASRGSWWGLWYKHTHIKKELLYIYVCGCAHTHIRTCAYCDITLVWEAEESFQKSVLSFQPDGLSLVTTVVTHWTSYCPGFLNCEKHNLRTTSHRILSTFYNLFLLLILG